MALDNLALRVTMRNWVTGVTVVTTALGEERSGMTVSSFTSVSLEPPTVLVCLNKLSGGKPSYTHNLVMRSGVFGVSMLASGQEAISDRFAGRDLAAKEDRFVDLDFTAMDTGSPLINGAIGWLDCRVVSICEVTTHTIFIGEVVYAWADPDKAPLVYYNRNYQFLTPIVENANS